MRTLERWVCFKIGNHLSSCYFACYILKTVADKKPEIYTYFRLVNLWFLNVACSSIYRYSYKFRACLLVRRNKFSSLNTWLRQFIINEKLLEWFISKIFWKNETLLCYVSGVVERWFIFRNSLLYENRMRYKSVFVMGSLIIEIRNRSVVQPTVIQKKHYIPIHLWIGMLFLGLLDL